MALTADAEVDYGPAPPRRGLRTGFTTGACAAAATRAACLALTGERPREVGIVLPAGVAASFTVSHLEVGDRWARAAVVKDAGDDPDVTHGAEVIVEVRLDVDAGSARGTGWRVAEPGAVSRRLAGGLLRLERADGVGIVTRPGLGLPVGGPAITPVPRRMIARSVRETLICGGDGAVVVAVGIRDGEALARRTLNGRLGIEGGLSILGTTGIVRPYSTAAWRASVLQGVDVAVASGCAEIVASTGGRSEAFARRLLDRLPEQAFVEMGEFTGHLLKRARDRRVRIVHLAGMIGKLSKIARGHFMTHVAGNQVDLAYLADLASRRGASSGLAGAVRAANTARHAQELLLANRSVRGFFDALCADVVTACAGLIGTAPDVRVLLFGFDGALLGRAPA